MILQGDTLELLKQMDDESVQCCVTSPPYWGLRDYGFQGQMGLEKTPQEYVERMVGVFREVRRVLKRDGTLWVNLGGSYASSQSNNGGYSDKSTLEGFSNPNTKGRRANEASKPHKLDHGLKPKDLVGIPWRIAFALQADGWWLRSDIIWAKPNPMPESVTDRPTKAHEYLFLLAKSERYYFDQGAVRENSKGTWNSIEMIDPPNATTKDAAAVAQGLRTREGNTFHLDMERTGRNIRTVWTIPTQPFPEAHFATFPEDLVKPCILAGSREGDTVLDPFCGSGTTGVVAARFGRKFIGIELNPEYVRMANRRIKQEQPLIAGTEPL